MVSSENFDVLHEIFKKIAQDSTTSAKAHVPASNASFDRDYTFGTISGETESNFGKSEQSFDADRTTSVIESRQSHISSKTKTYSKQSKGNDNEIDPEEQSPRPQDSPRVWSNNEISETIEYIGDALQYIEQWGVHHVKMLQASKRLQKASLGLSGTHAHENTGSTSSSHSSRQ